MLHIFKAFIIGIKESININMGFRVIFFPTLNLVPCITNRKLKSTNNNLNMYILNQNL